MTIYLFQFQRSVLVVFAQGVSVQAVSVQRVSFKGVYVLGGKCPGGYMSERVIPRTVYINE